MIPTLTITALLMLVAWWIAHEAYLRGRQSVADELNKRANALMRMAKATIIPGEAHHRARLADALRDVAEDIEDD